MAGFFAVSIDRSVYAPGASRIHEPRVERKIVRKLSPRAQYDLSPPRVLRKAYSVVAFAVVGLCCAPLVGRRRVVGCALAVGAFSTAIEIGQREIARSAETLLSNGFDVGCGLAGGALGALVYDRLERHLPRSLGGRRWESPYRKGEPPHS